MFNRIPASNARAKRRQDARLAALALPPLGLMSIDGLILLRAYVADPHIRRIIQNEIDHRGNKK